MTTIVICRHGHAEIGQRNSSDGDRALTLRGREEIRHAAAFLNDQDWCPTHVWSSPFVRAIQSAELLIAGLQYPGATTIVRALTPSGSVSDVLQALAEVPAESRILLVGHQPLAGTLVGRLLAKPMANLPTAATVGLRLSRAEPGGGQALWAHP
jgi:phosphohistidine phosphatase